MDANLAEADMESFRTEDIHALLTNLPPMCTDHLSQEVRSRNFIDKNTFVTFEAWLCCIIEKAQKKTTQH